MEDRTPSPERDLPERLDLVNEVIWKLKTNKEKLHFVAHDELRHRCEVLAIVERSYMHQDDEFFVVLDYCPFFGEFMGMEGDTGVLEAGGRLINVIHTATFIGYPALVCTHPRDSHGLYTMLFENTTNVYAVVNPDRREKLAIHNTACRTLLAALRDVLKDKTIITDRVFTNEEELYLDFEFPRELNEKEIAGVESQIKKWIDVDYEVVSRTMWFKEAKQRGAIYNEDAYKDVDDMAVVRVFQVPGVTMQLCPGVHVRHMKELGSFRVVRQEFVHGVLRIVAVCGENAAQ